MQLVFFYSWISFPWSCLPEKQQVLVKCICFFLKRVMVIFIIFLHSLFLQFQLFFFIKILNPFLSEIPLNCWYVCDAMREGLPLFCLFSLYSIEKTRSSGSKNYKKRSNTCAHFGHSNDQLIKRWRHSRLEWSQKRWTKAPVFILCSFCDFFCKSNKKIKK